MGLYIKMGFNLSLVSTVSCVYVCRVRLHRELKLTVVTLVLEVEMLVVLLLFLLLFSEWSRVELRIWVRFVWWLTGKKSRDH